MPGTIDDTEYVHHTPLGTRVAVPAVASPRAQQLRIVYGVLGSLATLRSRVLPLLRTSLRHEESVVFLQAPRVDDDAAADALDAFSVFSAEHPGIAFNVAVIDPIANMEAAWHNAWLDLPAIRHLAERYPGRHWYAIVDDDTYVLTATTRTILATYTGSGDSLPLVLGDTIRYEPPATVSTGRRAGYMTLKMKDGRRTTVEVMQRAPARPPHTFVAGGGGIFLNARTIEELRPHLDSCIAQHLQPGGDVRLGGCIATHAPNVTIVRRREFVKDSPMRALGELQLDGQFLLPASFHRVRTAALFDSLAAAEARRGRHGVVTWDDLRAELDADGSASRVKPFDFFPNSFPNCTVEYGRPPRTRRPLLPREVVAPVLPLITPGEWGGCDALRGREELKGRHRHEPSRA